MPKNQDPGACIVIVGIVIVVADVLVFYTSFLIFVGIFIVLMGICSSGGFNKRKSQTQSNQITETQNSKQFVQEAPQRIRKIEEPNKVHKLCPHCGARTTQDVCPECGSKID